MVYFRRRALEHVSGKSWDETNIQKISATTALKKNASSKLGAVESQNHAVMVSNATHWEGSRLSKMFKYLRRDRYQ